MKVLLLGGPRFLGYALIESLLAKNHEVIMFNRGKTNPELFPEVERITGNRDGEIANIGERTFDAVIDTCGYVPRVVKQSTDYLKDKTTSYVFISSISVYEDNLEPNSDETAEVIELDDKKTEDIMGKPKNYGGLKVLCEREAQKTFGNKATIIRPGLIVGPRDPTNRFTYWPVRIRKGGKVLAPGEQPCKVQIIDVRDLANFIVILLEHQKHGVYNATGPSQPFEFRDLAENIKNITKSSAEFNWVTNEWLKQQEVGPWMELPLWEPSVGSQSMMQVSIARAKADGLEFRSLEQTVKDTLQWYDEIDGNTKKWSAGLNADKETMLLQKLI